MQNLDDGDIYYGIHTNNDIATSSDLSQLHLLLENVDDVYEFDLKVNIKYNIV